MAYLFLYLLNINIDAMICLIERLAGQRLERKLKRQLGDALRNSPSLKNTL